MHLGIPYGTNGYSRGTNGYPGGTNSRKDGYPGGINSHPNEVSIHMLWISTVKINHGNP